MELEADNRGITEILEKHSLEMDTDPTFNQLKENRLPKNKNKKNTLGLGVKSSDKRASFPLSDMMLSMDTPTSSSAASSYPLQHMGPGGNAIAQAASQAIAATQQLTGRRTSSLKASFEAINLGVQTHEFSVGRELAGAAAAAISASSSYSSEGMEGPSPKRKKSTKVNEQVLDVVTGGLLNDPFMEPGTSADLLSAELRDQDWFDPNEPRYCICNQVSYGDMVACDNEDVSDATLSMMNGYHKALFTCSALMNGSIILALASKLLLRENGTVLLARPIWLGERAESNMKYIAESHFSLDRPHGRAYGES